MKWSLLILFTAGAALAAAQNASLPDGDGKAAVNGACTSCHGVDLITGKTATQQEWTGIVDRMKTYGASLSDAQTKTMVDYLAKSFGPKGATPAQAAGPSEAEMKALVSGVCSSCHGADLMTSKKATQSEWQGIVDRMKTYGASLDDKQTTGLVAYLTATYGTGAAPASAAAGPDPGQKTLENYCGSCHDLDLISNRKGTPAAEWQDIVDRMNARGAGVPAGEVGPLVQYLAKMYSAK